MLVIHICMDEVGSNKIFVACCFSDLLVSACVAISILWGLALLLFCG